MDTATNSVVTPRPQVIPTASAYLVESFTEPGVFYSVRLQGDRLTCTCPAFRFSQAGVCKHLAVANEHAAEARAAAVREPARDAAHALECETCAGTGQVTSYTRIGAYSERCDTTECPDCDCLGLVFVPGRFESAADNADLLRRIVRRNVGKLQQDDAADIVYAAAHLEHLQRELADALARNRALTAQLEHQTAERVRAEVELHDLQQHVAGVEREMAEANAERGAA